MRSDAPAPLAAGPGSDFTAQDCCRNWAAALTHRPLKDGSRRVPVGRCVCLHARSRLVAQGGSGRRGVLGEAVLDKRHATQPKPRAEAAPYAFDEGETMGREARVLRYKEKRKNRKFDKTIRYASRKAYAESRPRVKGRFVKRDDLAGGSSAALQPSDSGQELDLLSVPGMGLDTMLDPPLLWLEEHRSGARALYPRPARTLTRRAARRGGEAYVVVTRCVVVETHSQPPCDLMQRGRVHPASWRIVDGCNTLMTDAHTVRGR